MESLTLGQLKNLAQQMASPSISIFYRHIALVRMPSKTLHASKIFFERRKSSCSAFPTI